MRKEEGKRVKYICSAGEIKLLASKLVPTLEYIRTGGVMETGNNGKKLRCCCVM